MSDPKTEVSVSAVTSPVTQNGQNITVTVPKKKFWKIVAEVIGVVVALFIAFLIGERQSSIPKKNFTSTNDPTVVKTKEGELVKLPETKTEGQLIDKTVVSVATEAAAPVQIMEVKNDQVHLADTATGSPVAGSAGSLLFGADPNKL